MTEGREEERGAGHGEAGSAFPVEHVTIHGQQIAYRRGGEGPALLFLHGIAGSSQTWLPVMELLQGEYTMVAPDFLGHGQSAKPKGDYSLGNFASSMRDLLQVLDIDRVTVVGQSFGGGVAMQFAYQFPDRCERLVLVDAGGLGREVSWVLRMVTIPGVEYVLPAVFPSFARGWGDAVARLGHRLGFRNAQALEIWHAYRSLTDADSRRAFLRTMRSVIEPGGQSVNAMDRLYLAEQTPTLIVWGGKDRIIPLSMPTRRSKRCPTAGWRYSRCRPFSSSGGAGQIRRSAERLLVQHRPEPVQSGGGGRRLRRGTAGPSSEPQPIAE